MHIARTLTSVFLAIALAQSATAQTGKQLTLTKIEDFDAGHKMTYLSLKDSVKPGASGDGVVWNFSRISMLGADTARQEIIASEIAATNESYPPSNTIERSSDGMLLFVEKTRQSNKVWGMVMGDIRMKYTRPYLFIQRPFSYGDSIGSAPERSYDAFGGFKGSGVTKTVADGSGTLILPGGRYRALRVRFEQVFTEQGSSGKMVTRSVTYAWFDEQHAGALLRINNTTIESAYYNNQIKDVQLLLSENGQPLSPK